MNNRTLEVLEFHKIVAILAEEAATTVGKKRIESLQPATEFTEVEKLQAETDEAVTVLRLNKTVPLSHVVDITPYLQRSRLGGMLDSVACLHVAQVIYVARKVKEFIQDVEVELPLLEKYTAAIFTLRHIEQEIKAKIDEHGDIVDDATPTLKRIRQTIRAHEATIRERLQQLTKTKSNMLSDTIITIRNQRYVLPVKQEYRHVFGGIVHDQSASGQTLFMEPQAIIELNNLLQQQIVQEQQEIETILRELTALIKEHHEELANNLSIIAQIDEIFARAKLAQKMQATKPQLNKQGIIELKQVRHPLIAQDKVVANDIVLGKDYHALVITGPNTGGKTVTLKTLGLCTLMVQAGLQVPAMEEAKVAVFSKIFADIGDEQSIEQNLSTFSSHMTNIVKMMQHIDADTLVLFDELGAGTDPQEGAALAMALLDEVIARNARVVATTHYPELKAYGYNRTGVMNASVEFDVASLKPTYRLIIGVPGRSNALEISQRLGLAESIIQRAKKYLGVDTKNVENMITALEKTRKAAEKELDKAHELLLESGKLHADLVKHWEMFQQEKARLYKEAEQKANEAIEKARKEAESIVEEVKKMRDQALWKEHEWIEAQKMFDKAKPTLVTEETAQQTVEKTELKIGDEVKYLPFQQTGQVIERKSQQEFVVQIGIMKVTAKREELQFLGHAKQEKTEQVTKVITATQHVPLELDLRGERYEDAIHRLEEYIDQAVLQGYPRVTIIHGKGTGALKKGVEDFVKRSPYVKSARLGREGEGGSGVTIIEL